MSMTLIEAAKSAEDAKKSAIIDMFSQNSDLLRVWPFETITGGGIDYNREGTLPGVGFRGLNQAYSESVGVINPQHDPLKIAGGDLDVDKKIIKWYGMDQRSSREEMKVKALALRITKGLIKGDSSSDPREFDGLQKRLTGSQKLYGGASAVSAPGALSLSRLDEAIDAVDGANALIMNKGMRRRLTAAARLQTVGGFVETTKDEFGKTVTIYNGLPILISGRDNLNAEIIPDTEVAGDAGADSTSIYVVSLGSTMLTGIQDGTIEVDDLGQLQTQPVFRTRVEWGMGIALYHGRAASRYWNIDPTAVAVV